MFWNFSLKNIFGRSRIIHPFLKTRNSFPQREENYSENSGNHFFLTNYNIVFLSFNHMLEAYYVALKTPYFQSVFGVSKKCLILAWVENKSLGSFFLYFFLMNSAVKNSEPKMFVFFGRTQTVVFDPRPYFALRFWSSQKALKTMHLAILAKIV